MLNRSVLMYIEKSDIPTGKSNSVVNNCRKSVFISKPVYEINDIDVF